MHTQLSIRMTRSSPASLQSVQFNWQEIIAGNPEKDAKKVKRKVGPHGKLDQGIALKKLKLRNSTEQPQPVQPSTSAGVDSLKNPTPAMLEIISKTWERASLSSIGRKSNVESCFTSRLDSPYPFTLTIKEEKLQQLKEDDEISSASDLDNISDKLGDVWSYDSYSEDEDHFKIVRELRYSPPMRKKSENV